MTVNEMWAAGDNLSLVVKKLIFGFLTRSDTNQAVQPHKIARGSKFCMNEVEGLYYLCSENNGADQLRIYYKADLHLCLYAKTGYAKTGFLTTRLIWR